MTTESTIDELIKNLRSPDQNLRSAAGLALANLPISGVSIEKAIDSLIESVLDSNKTSNPAAVIALMSASQDPRTEEIVLDKLCTALSNKDLLYNSVYVLKFLGDHKIKIFRAFEPLTLCLENSDQNTRYIVALTLLCILQAKKRTPVPIKPGHMSSIVDSLIVGLQNPNKDIFFDAVLAIEVCIDKFLNTLELGQLKEKLDIQLRSEKDGKKRLSLEYFLKRIETKLRETEILLSPDSDPSAVRRAFKGGVLSAKELAKGSRIQIK
ncbi:MAG: hypothetical protein AABX38_04125 [Candidatus Micrarchaeota archaeon]